MYCQTELMMSGLVAVWMPRRRANLLISLYCIGWGGGGRWDDFIIQTPSALAYLDQNWHQIRLPEIIRWWTMSSLTASAAKVIDIALHWYQCHGPRLWGELQVSFSHYPPNPEAHPEKSQEHFCAYLYRNQVFREYFWRVLLNTHSKACCKWPQKEVHAVRGSAHSRQQCRELPRVGSSAGYFPQWAAVWGSAHSGQQCGVLPTVGSSVRFCPQWVAVWGSAHSG